MGNKEDYPEDVHSAIDWDEELGLELFGTRKVPWLTQSGRNKKKNGPKSIPDALSASVIEVNIRIGQVMLKL